MYKHYVGAMNTSYIWVVLVAALLAGYLQCHCSGYYHAFLSNSVPQRPLEYLLLQYTISLVCAFVFGIDFQQKGTHFGLQATLHYASLSGNLLPTDLELAQLVMEDFVIAILNTALEALFDAAIQ